MFDGKHVLKTDIFIAADVMLNTGLAHLSRNSGNAMNEELLELYDSDDQFPSLQEVL